MALFASHLLICFFTFGSLSPLALILNIPYLGFFPLLFMANLFYFGSSYIVLFNWIEPFMRMFIVSVHYGAKLIQGNEWEASLGLLLAVWMILLKKPKFFFAFFLALHCISAKAPTILRSGPF
jgi:hypothetical protein